MNHVLLSVEMMICGREQNKKGKTETKKRVEREKEIALRLLKDILTFSTLFSNLIFCLIGCFVAS